MHDVHIISNLQMFMKSQILAFAKELLFMKTLITKIPGGVFYPIWSLDVLGLEVHTYQEWQPLSLRLGAQYFLVSIPFSCLAHLSNTHTLNESSLVGRNLHSSSSFQWTVYSPLPSWWAYSFPDAMKQPSQKLQMKSKSPKGEKSNWEHFWLLQCKSSQGW